ncbi:lysozyme [Novosphingobium rosa]|uniref:lysozyme n=1 Tax=Novosphingobium rosa TaxID=76978 RepID=UPI000836CBC6|nr:lysozyme [Novosphingobium rosa]
MADPAQNEPAPKSARKGTLVALIGAASALGVFTLIPAEESGRKVSVSIAQDGTAQIQNVSGPQYLVAYLDMVKVPTACDGLTGPDIKAGMRFTPAQCTARLQDALIQHAQGVMACTPGLKLGAYRRDNVRTAMVSLGYNVGTGAYCRSSIPGKINTGHIREACDALLSFNRAGGRVVSGLTARRQRERAICMKDAA